MFRRVWYSIARNTSQFCRRVLVFAVLFFFITLSLRATSLSSIFQKEFEENFDILISIQYDNQEYNDYDLNEENLIRTGRLMNEIENVTDLEYADVQSVWVPPYASMSRMDGNDLTIYIEETVPGLKYNNALNSIKYQDRTYSSHSFRGVRERNFIEKRFYASFEISAGRTFSNDELRNGDAVCIVNKDSRSYSLVSGEQIAVGDLIPITFYYIRNGEILDSYTNWVEVIGLCSSKETVYFPESYLKELKSKGEKFILEHDPDYFEKVPSNQWHISRHLLEVKTLDDLNTLIDYIESMPEFQEGKIFYSAATDRYANLLSNMTALSDSFRYIAVICLFLTIMITFVLSCLDAIYRQKELSILKSMGESSRNILFQSGLETFIAIILSLGISLPLSKHAVSLYAKGLMEENPLGSVLANNPLLGNSYNPYEYGGREVTITIDTALSSGQSLILVVLVGALFLATSLFTALILRRLEVREVLGSE